MKGVIMAGGLGTRLFPITIGVSKQMLPVYNKPMIYYPLSTLMLAGIRDILIISTPEDTARYMALLDNGVHLGIRVSYARQPFPGGLAQAFILGEAHIGDSACAMILGDNFFYGRALESALLSAADNAERGGRATAFAHKVRTPKQYGIVEWGRGWKPVSIEEKPSHPKSRWAATGLYFYPKGVSLKARSIQPSARGELEISSLNTLYMQEDLLDVMPLPRTITWMDMGGADSLYRAAAFVRRAERRIGALISAPEEIAYRQGWTDKAQLAASAARCSQSPYGAYLKALAERGGAQ
ncbi:MAG: glucose-1-phosphate thymidylyltransferase RfbA [Oscillospiraceae bacterium]|jgi:glucose-1-phosphate thymidylyltransferase|nr:glucose-1-phosphate thymidylyltransferase RfbA [Oscillospiraceae bacterium]